MHAYHAAPLPARMQCHKQALQAHRLMTTVHLVSAAAGFVRCVFSLYVLALVSGIVHDLNDADCLRSHWPVSDVNVLQALAVVGKRKINRWSTVAEMVGSRGQIQCRERYVNVLDPGLKSGSLHCLVLHSCKAA